MTVAGSAPQRGAPARQTSLRAAPARQTSLRAHNLALVLAEVADRGPASRARLAAATGLTKATVSTLVDALVGANLLTELGPDAATGVGRPGSALGLPPSGPVGIGLEVNVDYLATCTVDLAGTVRARELVAEDFRGLPHATALGWAAGALGRALDGAAAQGVPVAGVSVAVPGLVESATGLLRVAPNLGWRDVAVLADLRRECARLGVGLGGLQLQLDNEANFAALGELWCGGQARASGGPLETFVHVSGEIGVGAGIVIDGRLFRGSRGFSGEIGHVPIGRSGAALEQLAGQEAILRRAGLVQRPRTTSGRPQGPVGELVAQARAGRRRALDAIHTAGTALGTGIAGIVNLVDVDTVVLGGLYAVLAPWILDPVQVEVAQRVLSCAWDPVQVLVSRLAGEAAVRGAATSAVRAVIANPSAWLAGR